MNKAAFIGAYLLLAAVVSVSESMLTDRESTDAALSVEQCKSTLTEYYQGFTISEEVQALVNKISQENPGWPEVSIAREREADYKREDLSTECKKLTKEATTPEESKISECIGVMHNENLKPEGIIPSEFLRAAKACAVAGFRPLSVEECEGRLTEFFKTIPISNKIQALVEKAPETITKEETTECEQWFHSIHESFEEDDLGKCVSRVPDLLDLLPENHQKAKEACLPIIMFAAFNSQAEPTDEKEPVDEKELKRCIKFAKPFYMNLDVSQDLVDLTKKIEADNPDWPETDLTEDESKSYSSDELLKQCDVFYPAGTSDEYREELLHCASVVFEDEGGSIVHIMKRRTGKALSACLAIGWADTPEPEEE